MGGANYLEVEKKGEISGWEGYRKREELR